MRNLTDNHLRILRCLLSRGSWTESLLTTSGISRCCAPRRMSDWAGPKLVALEKKGLVRRAGAASSGAETWDITEAGIVELQSQRR